VERAGVIKVQVRECMQDEGRDRADGIQVETLGVAGWERIRTLSCRVGWRWTGEGTIS
jgi:hypothetical protein